MERDGRQEKIRKCRKIVHKQNTAYGKTQKARDRRQGMSGTYRKLGETKGSRG